MDLKGIRFNLLSAIVVIDIVELSAVWWVLTVSRRHWSPTQNRVTSAQKTPNFELFVERVPHLDIKFSAVLIVAP